MMVSFEFDAPFFSRKGVEKRLMEATRSVELSLLKDEGLFFTHFKVQLDGPKEDVMEVLKHPHIKPLTGGRFKKHEIFDDNKTQELRP